MADKKLAPENFPIRLEGDCLGKDIVPVAASVHEGLNVVTSATVEFISTDKALDLGTIVGRTMPIVLDKPDGKTRAFRGTCVAAEFVSEHKAFAQFSAEIRAWPWFLDLTRDNRIFQDKTTPEIIKAVLSDHGFEADDRKLGSGWKPRPYCTQYRESDLAFITRLMEEEGIYFYIDHAAETEQMILCDGPGCHQPIPGEGVIDFFARDPNKLPQHEHVFQWSLRESVRSGKVVLRDYNFEKPRADIVETSAMKKGTHSHGSYELYDYPGRFREVGEGDPHAKTRMTAQAQEHRVWRGASNAMDISVGHTFELRKPPRETDATNVLVLDATHHMRLDLGNIPQLNDLSDFSERLGFVADDMDPYRVTFAAIPKDTQYSPPAVTPLPEIAGLQTAVVVGPKGEEIYTDKYGRVKVQFHWDRESQPNENASCFVRTAMPWTGKNWGMIAIPRIGQEVVIQFEEGNPDRPIITGMLYNADTMPPYGLSQNMTQSGIKTNSSKGGGGFNELMFEDKKGEELVRFQAEKNFRQIVKNDADITIGKEKNDPGNLTLFVQNDQTETTVKHKKQTVGESYNLQIGNKTSHSDLMSSASKLFSQLRFSASPSVSGMLKMGYDNLMNAAAANSFNETIEGAHSHVVTVDHQQMIGGKHDHNVIGKLAQTVGLDHDHLVGVDYNQEIKRHHKQTVDDDYIQKIKGKNEKTVTKDMTSTVEQGDIKINAKMGQIEIEAMKKIVLKVGSNNIELSQQGIKVNGIMIEVSGKTTTEVKGSAMLTLKGGMTMIN